MTLEETLEMETLQLPVIFLHRAGTHWRAYEYSACRFARDFPFIEHRLYKWEEHNQQEERICLSFPVTQLSLFIEQYPHAHIASDLIAIPSEYALTARDLAGWKESVPVSIIE